MLNFLHNYTYSSNTVKDVDVNGCACVFALCCGKKIGSAQQFSIEWICMFHF